MNIRIIPANWSPYLLAILRIVTGLLFLEHGTGKLLDFPAAVGGQMPHALLLFAGTMEIVGGALMTVGFLTRPVAFVLSGYMAVAYFMEHFPRSFFPTINHGEAAIFFCFIFLYFAAVGSSVWAVDKA